MLFFLAILADYVPTYRQTDKQTDRHADSNILHPP